MSKVVKRGKKKSLYNFSRPGPPSFTILEEGQETEKDDKKDRQ